MILSKRKSHFYSFIVLACLLPLIFITGIFFRPEYKPANDSTTSLFAISGAASAQNYPQKTLIKSQTITSKNQYKLLVKTFNIASNSILLEVTPTQALTLFDPLLYWYPGNQIPEEINNNAILLGILAGKSHRSFILPREAIGEEGQLLIYTQGNKEIVANFSFPASITQP